MPNCTTRGCNRPATGEIEIRRRTGHVFPSNPAGAEVPHLLITVCPDRRYLALTAEVAAVRGGTRDICKVVSAPKGDEYAAD